MDYKLLLKKYMKYLLLIEGTDFINFNLKVLRLSKVIDAKESTFKIDDPMDLTKEDIVELTIISENL